MAVFNERAKNKEQGTNRRDCQSCMGEVSGKAYLSPIARAKDYFEVSFNSFYQENLEQLDYADNSQKKGRNYKGTTA